jgi:hypothetical protein
MILAGVDLNLISPAGADLPSGSANFHRYAARFSDPVLQIGRDPFGQNISKNGGEFMDLKFDLQISSRNIT